MKTISKKSSRPALGGHVSAAGGFDKIFDRGEAIGAEVVQIFVSSPRAWAVSQPSSELLKRYNERKKVSVIQSVHVHGTYLANLGAESRELYQKSCKSVLDEFSVSNAIGAKSMIFHAGSRLGGPKVWLDQVAASIKEVLQKVPGKTFLALENAAGGGDKIGNQPEELAVIMKKVKSPRLKICIDTAHALESGLIPEYSPAGIKATLRDLDKTIGLENIVALHINDSKTKPYSKHDRHENIGEGYIGLSGFRNLSKEKSLWHADWLLEVPGFENTGPDKKNVNIIKKIFDKSQ
ncbi:MAG: deoxyribonuclease IV [Patescibacteria group bacterium]